MITGVKADIHNSFYLVSELQIPNSGIADDWRSTQGRGKFREAGAFVLSPVFPLKNIFCHFDKFKEKKLSNRKV
jgi:hypothetical protein